MSVKFTVFAVLIVLSFLFIIWAYYIKVEKPKIDDKVVLTPEEDYAKKRYERHISLQYWSCVLAFFAGCMMGVLAGFICFFVAFIIARMAMLFRKCKS